MRIDRSGTEHQQENLLLEDCSSKTEGGKNPKQEPLSPPSTPFWQSVSPLKAESAVGQTPAQTCLLPGQLLGEGLPCRALPCPSRHALPA